MTKTPPPQQPCPGISGQDGALRIVVADDCTEVREFLSLVLSRHGFEVVGFAVNGEDAVRLAREMQPDVVLMDINMPGIGGIAATAMLRTSAPKTRIVGLSSCEDDVTIARMFTAGASTYLVKPATNGDLIKTLRAVAEHA